MNNPQKLKHWYLEHKAFLLVKISHTSKETKLNRAQACEIFAQRFNRKLNKALDNNGLCCIFIKNQIRIMNG